MNSNAKRLVTVLLSAAIPAACSNNGPATTQTTTGSKLSDYAASWDGYAEAYTFMPSGSDRVRLTIDGNGQGTLRFGDGALFPPPTDPNVGYPPPTVVVDAGANFDVYGAYTPSEGFVYPIYATQIQINRIQLGVNTDDLYAAWCALQTPVLWSWGQVSQPEGGVADVGGEDGGSVVRSYNCLPNLGTSGGCATGCCLVTADGQSGAVDCAKLSLCSFPSSVCTCTATSCAGEKIATDTPPVQYPIALDAALDSTGADLTGTLVLSQNRITVHMQKQ
jgi:hypothetical protein